MFNLKPSQLSLNKKCIPYRKPIRFAKVDSFGGLGKRLGALKDMVGVCGGHIKGLKKVKRENGG